MGNGLDVRGEDDLAVSDLPAGHHEASRDRRQVLSELVVALTHAARA
jgi:hypothetical protein